METMGWEDEVRSSTPLPTDAELRILQVLWRCGPRTVREVHERLTEENPVRYTTALKILQNMLAKGLVHRDDSGRSHVFEAAVDEEGTTGRLLAEVTDRVFAGSTTDLVLRALSTKRASSEELDQIRELLARMEDES